MIHHLSISAQSPERVAAILAELMAGRSFPFPVFPGAYIALAGDAEGTAVEVLPLGQVLVPGAAEEEVCSATAGTVAKYSATHFALSSSLSAEQILAIGKREGLRSLPFCRVDNFHLTEIWLEDRLLVEVMSPEQAQGYREFLTIENYEAFLSTTA